jgi:hypothetical protein
MAFEARVPYIYEYITKLCRQQAEVIQIVKVQMFAHRTRRSLDRKVGGFNLAAVKLTAVQKSKLPL